MDIWEAKDFANNLLAGRYDGHLSERVAKLSRDQLEEVILAMASMQGSKKEESESE